MVRIAVCSRNGIAVDEHFTQAACFYIYDVGRNTFGLAGMRLSRQYAANQRTHFDEEMLNGIYNLLSDCEFVFTEAIEYHLRQWLENKKLVVVAGRHSITELTGIVKKLKK